MKTLLTISKGIQYSVEVLKHLKRIGKHLQINVGCFTNCREQGYTYCLTGYVRKEDGEYIHLPVTYMLRGDNNPLKLPRSTDVVLIVFCGVDK